MFTFSASRMFPFDCLHFSANGIFLWIFRRAPKVFIGQGRFSEARAQLSFFFQIISDKLRDHVVILNLRGLKGCNNFNGTTMVGAVGKILKIMLARLFQIAISEL